MKPFCRVVLFLFFLATMLFNHSILYQIMCVILILCSFAGCLLVRKFNHHSFFIFYIFFLLFILWQLLSGKTYNTLETIRLGTTVAINFLIYFFLFNFIVNFRLFEDSLRFYLFSSSITALFLVAYTMSTGSLFSTRLMVDSVVSVGGLELEYNPNAIANYCCLSTTIILFGESLIPKHIRRILFLFFVFVIFISGSRKALLLFLASVIVKYFSSANYKNILRNSILVLSIIALTFYLVLEIPVFYDIIGQRLETMLDFFHGGGDSSMTSRADYIEIGWSIFQSHFFYGVGLGCFMSFANTDAYSHNDYIELLSGCGIIGCILAYLPKISVFISNLKTKSEYRTLFLIIMIQLFAAAFGTVSYYKREDWLLFIIVMSFCVFLKGKQYLKADGDKY